jgi:phage terminase large subunit
MYVDKGYKDALIVADSAEKRLIAEIKRKGIPNIKPSIKGQGSIYLISEHSFFIVFVIYP